MDNRSTAAAFIQLRNHFTGDCFGIILLPFWTELVVKAGMAGTMSADLSFVEQTILM